MKKFLTLLLTFFIFFSLFQGLIETQYWISLLKQETFVVDTYNNHSVYTTQSVTKKRASLNNNNSRLISHTSEDERLSNSKHISFPPLSSLIRGSNITGNVDFLLDFAIIGFAKTGTTTLSRRFFERHPEIMIPHDEIYLLKENRPAEMTRLLYSFKPGENFKRGYKAPRDIATSHTLDLIDQYWPSAKLIVGVRHPVSWFSSYYNYRLRSNLTMPPADMLTGKCRSEMTQPERLEMFLQWHTRMDDRGVCADMARYHDRLSLLGKTNILHPDESILLGSSRRHTLANRAPIHNQVFLYDITQIGDANFSRLELFLRDLQNYMGLTTPFALPSQKQHFEYKKDMFDICQEKHTKLRKVLLKNGKEAAAWIRSFFIHHPEVTVSSIDFFEESLAQWHIDPCPNKRG